MSTPAQRARQQKSGIVVMCVYCKSKRTIPFADAAKLTEPPMCEKPLCGGVMVNTGALA